jgi:hypothetical protein
MVTSQHISCSEATMQRCKEKVYLSLYPKNLPSIASGATPFENAGRAPDEISVSKNNKGRLVYWCYSHQEGIYISQKLDNPKIFSIETVKQG